MIEITVAAEGQELRKQQFEELPVTIGRGDDNDLILASRGCSRHHAEIVRDAGGYRLRDLGSTNGILFGSQMVRELPLADGLEATIGEHRLTFALPDQKGPEATVRMSYGQMTAGAPPSAVAKPEPPPAAMPPLYLVFGRRRGERYLKVVPGTEYILGRSPSADLVLEDHKSSKRHALVHARDGHYQIVDLQSSNGTFVNGERIREASLSAGDEIVIGNTPIQVKDQILDLIDQANLLDRTSFGIPTQPDEEPGEQKRRPGRHPLVVPLAIAIVLAAAAGTYFGSRRLVTPPADVPPPPPGATAPRLVQVEPVRSRELVFDFSGSGSVKAQSTVTVSAEVPGRVMDLSVGQGDSVTRGAPLARLDDRDVRHQIDAARSSISTEQVRLAREDYQRKERLFNEGAVVRSVYEQAKNRYLTLDSTFRSTQATIAQLEGQLAKTRVTAPISGTATRIFAEVGEFVGPGSPLLSLENMDEVLVEVELADRDFVKIGPGQAVEATAGAFPGRLFKGQVVRLGSAADPVTRTFKVEARLQNPGLVLRPGMIVSVRIILGRESGLVVPAEAVVEREQGRTLVFLARDGTARLLEVGLGRRLDREVQVTEGLSEGDEVVVVGHEGLVDGQAIETYRKQ